MKLERKLSQHAKGVPEVIAEGSKAQIIFCIADAKKDIATLATALRELVHACNRYDEQDEHSSLLSANYIAAKERAESLLK